jgi:isoleucyl-tRNA synthetase
MPGPLFARVPPELDFPKEEREVLRFWQDRGIFEKTLTKPSPRGRFVFYEGPPTANGLPHNGHVLTRVIKDVFPRYKTMRGWAVPRKAGWDTHGLPVEVEVEKELHLHGKAAIEAYGVEPFVRKCIESVFRYTEEWEELTTRVGFWVDLRDAYVTYYRSYVESVWWALGELFDKGLLYQGHKVVWWWAQGGTALSAGEVGQGYKAVDDPSVYVRFPLVVPGEEDVSLLVWTTTPWTLPSNMYAAVRADLDYAVVRSAKGARYVVAQALVDALAKKLGELVVERTMKGRDLVGMAYRPPYDLFAADAAGFADVVWRVIAADFVTTDSGTGIVHIAPAFGEDDHEAHRKLARGRPDLPLFCAVKPDGTFVEAFALCAGRWVKDSDKTIQRDLDARGLLVLAETYRHDYPFCWRADSDPLIQYARPAWYIRTTAAIDRAIANNRQVDWIPDHIKEGRFGDFLAHNVDWALSRERWWGTPLNVWVCDADGEHKEAPRSVAAIEARNGRAFEHFHAARRADPSLSEHLIVHKPWVDQVAFPCARCHGTMRRVPEVIDCWFDSGCMPFAQWGYPHAAGSKERFEQSFPADFISEAIDQTRGWFYSLLMISTLVFEHQPLPHPYKTCIVLGHVSDKEGKKESKSKGNYTPPEIILDKVAMEFAVIEDPAAKKGVVLIGRDDLEGLDLQEGARARVYRPGASEGALDVVLRAAKKLRRRVAVVHPDDRAALGVVPTASPDVLPVAVPRLPVGERVVVEDPATPAPGADAFRWFFYAASPPWSATRHSLSNVRDMQKDFAVKLRNVYSFFTIYANIDGFTPRSAGDPETPLEGRPEIDRWILGELTLTTREVTARMDQYDVYTATQRLVSFVDALSNWYVRRSRARFWRSGWDEDKRSAYDTLYACLVAVAKLMAPFTPYAAEGMYQNLVVRGGRDARESVHLEDWPDSGGDAVDEALSRKMILVRDLVSVGLRARMDSKVKVRQPLRRATIVLNDDRDRDLVASAAAMVREELNVLDVALGTPAQRRDFGTVVVKPNFRSLGQRGLGKLAQELKAAWASGKGLDAAFAALDTGEGVWEGVNITRDDVEMTFEPKPGFAAATDRVGSVFLDVTLDDELRDLGLVRELQYRIQAMRKDLGLEYTDRIHVSVVGGVRVARIVEEYRAVLAAEVLAVDVSTRPLPNVTLHDHPDGAEVRELDVEGETVRLGLARVRASNDPNASS